MPRSPNAIRTAELSWPFTAPNPEPVDGEDVCLGCWNAPGADDFSSQDVDQ